MRPRRPAAAKLALLLCLPCAAGIAAAQAYKWVDADGKTHFADTPPADRKAERIAIKPQVPENPAAAARSRGWQAQIEESGVQRLEAQQKREAEERKARTAEYNCQTARRELDTLSRQQRVYNYGKDGQRQYLDDKDRPAALKAAQDRVDRECR